LTDLLDTLPTSADDPRCKPFTDIFSKNSETKVTGRNAESRFRALWAQGASKANMAFIGIDRRINNLKGNLLNPNLRGVGQADTAGTDAAVDNNLNLWNDIAIAFAVLKSFDTTKEQFKIINANYYRGL
jgi:hypothetical protein